MPFYYQLPVDTLPSTKLKAPRCCDKLRKAVVILGRLWFIFSLAISQLQPQIHGKCSVYP